MTNFAIIGYGNLGKACERVLRSRKDARVAGIFTRRDPEAVKSPYGAPVFRQDEIFSYEGQVDCALICVGSAGDVMGLTDRLAVKFNTADSFDTHAKMAEYIAMTDEAAKRGGHVSLIGAGWDPGIFSMMRALFDGILSSPPQTFWGTGVSQGHSEAVRRIEGVRDAKQYTVPDRDAMELARKGAADGLSERAKHRRICYVVPEEGADLVYIDRKIRTMPYYFEPYDVDVRFISQKTLDEEHAGMPHGGRVIGASHINGKRSGMEFSVDLESNPDFTAATLISYAYAALRMHEAGYVGALTVQDVPVSALFDGDARKYL